MPSRTHLRLRAAMVAATVALLALPAPAVEVTTGDRSDQRVEEVREASPSIVALEREVEVLRRDVDLLRRQLAVLGATRGEGTPIAPEPRLDSGLALAIGLSTLILVAAWAIGFVWARRRADPVSDDPLRLHASALALNGDLRALGADPPPRWEADRRSAATRLHDRALPLQ